MAIYLIVMPVSLRRRNKEKDIILLRRLELFKLEKMNGQNRSVNNIHQPRYVKMSECGEYIEREKNLKDFDCKVIELGKEEEGENVENFICKSIDKDYEIEGTLVSMDIILRNLTKNVELMKERHTRLCELTNLQMSGSVNRL